jgi:hypothetical protein
VRFLRDRDISGFVTTTQNLSSGGFYCFSPVPLRSGHLGSCVLEVPTHRSQASLLLHCTVRVLRVEPSDQEGVCGVGCQIENYWLLRKTDTA